uniref:Uncharacterized protein n=1 Tax=Canis lupus dingo TaxID=286419 RepID=A0A8C0R2E6_CANLU
MLFIHLSESERAREGMSTHRGAAAREGEAGPTPGGAGHGHRPRVPTPAGARPWVPAPAGARPQVPAQAGARPQVPAPAGARPQVPTQAGARPRVPAPAGARPQVPAQAGARPQGPTPAGARPLVRGARLEDALCGWALVQGTPQPLESSFPSGAWKSCIIREILTGSCHQLPLGPLSPPGSPLCSVHSAVIPGRSRVLLGQS